MSIPTTKTTAKNLWQVTCHFSNFTVNKSWSESHWVDVREDDPTSGVTLASATVPAVTEIINFRLPLLAGDEQMVYARVSNTLKGNNATAVVLVPKDAILVDSETDAEGSNMPNNGFLLRLESSLALTKAYRAILGLRDGAIAGAVNNVTSFSDDISAYTLPGVATGQTMADSFKSWFTVLKTKTFFARYKRGIYTIAPWSTVKYVRCCDRHLAPLFGSQPTRRRS
jgi:hypothetical protein